MSFMRGSRAAKRTRNSSVDADVALGPPKRTCPAPDGAEHLLVKPADEIFIEDVAAPAREKPAVGVGDADLLGRVEFPALGDVARNQRIAFLGGQRCRRIVLVIEQFLAAHGASQRRRGSPLRRSFKRRSRSSLRSGETSAWFSSRMVWLVRVS